MLLNQAGLVVVQTRDAALLRSSLGLAFEVRDLGLRCLMQVSHPVVLLLGCDLAPDRRTELVRARMEASVEAAFSQRLVARSTARAQDRTGLLSALLASVLTWADHGGDFR